MPIGHVQKSTLHFIQKKKRKEEKLIGIVKNVYRIYPVWDISARVRSSRARKPLRGNIPSKDDLLTMELTEDMFPADFYRWDVVVERESANGVSDVRRHVFLQLRIR